MRRRKSTPRGPEGGFERDCTSYVISRVSKLDANAVCLPPLRIFFALHAPSPPSRARTTLVTLEFITRYLRLQRNDLVGLDIRAGRATLST